MESTSIAFIGSVGVPNVYGGFEAFLETSVPELARRGHNVCVTCDASRYEVRETKWRGANRFFINIKANGALSIFHDLIAFLRVFKNNKNIVVLGVSAGIFFPLFRIMCDVTNKNLIVNVDGLEWRRSKFSLAKRIFLKLSDAFAQLCAHSVIIDNEGLKPFLTPVGSKKAFYIPYSGDHVIRLNRSHISTNPILLTICRIEPENNCDLLLNSFKDIGFGSYVFVGNWNSSEYGIKLRREFGPTPGLILLDPIYDHVRLAELRESCVGYIHGHSVGGTNPSLVEMLFYDSPIAAYDCIFNVNTAGVDADYFKTSDVLSKFMVNYLSENRVRSKTRRHLYTCTSVVSSYETKFK
jgi:glycosyltransferase involved in cell wall biosynthesis